ncbi:hypothetical protein [Candidatus Nitrosocosmicus sp. T]
MTLRTARVTKIERFGNSPGENDEMVSRISIPLIIVELIIIRSRFHLHIDFRSLINILTSNYFII